jgi:hypothetical protein
MPKNVRQIQYMDDFTTGIRSPAVASSLPNNKVFMPRKKTTLYRSFILVGLFIVFLNPCLV